ncbi:MAG: adenosylcobinamide-GDP ribazoletransferase [Alphaproteobacteria bacterium]|jgi:adenosylcobinamide-GDP ribazoletransferase
MSQSNDGQHNTGRDEVGAALNPAAILGGWWNATRTIAAVFARPPLEFAGCAPARPGSGEIARAARGFPVVGAVLGLTSALVLVLADGLGLPIVLSAILAVALSAYLGGTLGESGLARSADAIIGGGTKADVLAAMRRRSHGTYGTIVIVTAFALKVAALATLAGPGAAAAALIAALAASHAVMPILLHYMEPVREAGLAAEAGRPQFDEMVLAAALGAAVALLFLGPWTGLIALAVAAAGALKFAWLAKRCIGGVTGAVLGAAQQGAEIGILLAVAALA